jgi:hypothetical protein
MSAETLVRPAPAAEEDEAETDDEDNYTTHEPVQGLSTQGVNQSEINKLVDAGITTLGQILQKTSKDLQNIKGFSEAKIEKVDGAPRVTSPRLVSPRHDYVYHQRDDSLSVCCCGTTLPSFFVFGGPRLFCLLLLCPPTRTRASCRSV